MRGENTIKNETTNLGYLLWAALRKQQGLVGNAIQHLDISMKEYTALMMISERSGLTQLETGQLLQIDRTSIGHLVDSLCEKELVERKTSKTDRRAYLLHLTEKGVQATKELRKIATQCSDICLSTLSVEERKQFLQALQKISKENEHE